MSNNSISNSIWLPPTIINAIKSMEGSKYRLITEVRTNKDCTYYLDGKEIITIKNSD